MIKLRGYRMSFSLSNIFSSLTKSSARSVAPTTATVGVDLGSSSVKVVAIEQTAQALMLRTYGELQLGPYDNKSLGEAVTLDAKKKTEAIIDVFRESQVQSNHGALAMPLSSSFLTVMSLKTRPGEDLASRVTVEAKKYVPLPLADVTLDWNELPQLDGADSNVSEIMLAAIEKKALAEYNGILNTIGMAGEPAEIEAFSLIRSLWRHDDTTLAIVDLGARTAKLYIVRNEILERIHRVGIGGQAVTNRLAKLLNVSFTEAESMKRSYQKSDPQSRDIYKTMATVLDNPLNEFNQFINHYEQRQGSKINRIVLTGGVASSPYVIPYLKDRWSREVEIGNPFAKLAYPAFMEDTLTSIAPVFGVSIGAALRQFQY